MDAFIITAKSNFLNERAVNEGIKKEIDFFLLKFFLIFNATIYCIMWHSAMSSQCVFVCDERAERCGRNVTAR